MGDYVEYPVKPEPTDMDEYLDKPVFGAGPISRVVGLTERQTYDGLEKGRLDGDKFGKLWVSTPRRLLAPFQKRARESETTNNAT